ASKPMSRAPSSVCTAFLPSGRYTAGMLRSSREPVTGDPPHVDGLTAADRAGSAHPDCSAFRSLCNEQPLRPPASMPRGNDQSLSPLRASINPLPLEREGQGGGGSPRNKGRATFWSPGTQTLQTTLRRYRERLGVLPDVPQVPGI